MVQLFRIQPRGLGTEEIEGFSSYLVRVASAHAVSVGRLISRLAASREIGNVGDFSQSFATGLPALVRPSPFTRDVVELIAGASGVEPGVFESMTFLCLSNSLDSSAGTYSQHLRWCAECMAECEKKGEPGYFKLLWHLEAVKHCPQHGLPLSGKCLHCQSHQSTARLRTDCSSCANCGNSLGAMVNNINTSLGEKSAAADLSDLVKRIAQSRSTEFPRDGVRLVLRHLLEEAWKTENYDRIWDHIPKSEWLTYTECDGVIRLAEARHIALRLGIRLVDLLQGSAIGSSRTINSKLDASCLNELHTKRAKKLRKSALGAALKNLLKGSEFTPTKPLTWVAMKLGVTSDVLWRYYPSESKEIVARHLKAGAIYLPDPGS